MKKKLEKISLLFLYLLILFFFIFVEIYILYFEVIKKEEKKKEITYDKKGNLAFEYEGTNPIAPFNAPRFATPSIDVEGKINFMDNPDGSLSIKGELTGDDFPFTEAFIIPEGSNTKVFLGIGQIDVNVNPNSGGYDVPVALLNYYEKPISNFDLTLIYDDENNVTHVKNNNIKDSKPIALDTWNKIYENTSPQKKSE